MPQSDPRSEEPAGRRGLLAGLPLTLRWLVLGTLSLALALGFALAHIAAGFLLGPMIAAAVLLNLGSEVKVPRPPFVMAQAVVGALIARSFTPGVLGEITARWPLFLGGIVSIIVAAMVLGLLLARSRVLPGTSAIWGSFPGAATAMTLMAGNYGADVRLVAFMQYLRLLFVALAASGLAAAFGGASGVAGPLAMLRQAVDFRALGITLALCAAAATLAARFKVRAGPLMVSFLVTVVAQDLGLARLELPEALLVAAYALVGWSVGGRFTPRIIAQVGRALPRVALSTLVLLLVCGALSAVLVFALGIPPMTAYLALSPGGADSVAIIAAGVKVDVPFVMAMQLGRSLTVMVLGPALARTMVRWSGVAD